MSPLEVLRFALGALLGQRTRTLLSLVGVAIGTAAVVLLTALGEGARRYVVLQFSSLGTNILIVIPGRTETTGAIPGIGGVPNDLSLDDARALARSSFELRNLAPVVVGNERVSSGGRSRDCLIIGSTPEFGRIRELSVSVGSFLPDVPWDRGAPVTVLGRTLARELFPGRSPIGENVRIGEHRMRVIGVLEGKGEHLGFDLDEIALVPVATGMQMFDRTSLFRILMQTWSNADVARARQRVLDVLVERHGEEDVTVLTQDAVIGSLSAILGVLTLAVAGIGAISLSVAGIGIMNVMLVSVSERTGEVGLFKAIGARARQVLAIFLAESALLATAGGLLGLGLGWLAVRVLVLVYPALPASPPPWAVLAALGTALGVGLVFGLLPARNAMRMDPVEALAARRA